MESLINERNSVKFLQEELSRLKMDFIERENEVSILPISLRIQLCIAFCIEAVNISINWKLKG